jgi:outer membrane biosynthesis protein TonB
VIRRSFRIGLWLGILAGATAALLKLLRSREAASPAFLDLGGTQTTPAPTRPAAWPPLEAPVTTPDPVEVPAPTVEATVPSDEAGLVVVGETPLQPPEEFEANDEPLDGEPTTAEETQPTSAAKKAAPRRTPARTAPPAKKAAARKSAAKKAAPQPPAAAEKVVLPPWVAPDGMICPETHPIKAKLSSQLFHLPGMFAYARTTPDRCYATPEDAIADGLRSAKR